MSRLAVTADFLGAMAKLPKTQQKKTLAFLEKWQADSKSAAINFEKIHNMRDERVRTVRIDQKYRAVMLHPDDGDVYVLVWVDNHDEAMDWAKNKEFGVNPATGAFQIINVDEVQKLVDEVSDQTDGLAHSIFQCDDTALASFGIPEILLPAIKGMTSADEIQQLTGVLPEEIVEALVWLADGVPVEEVRQSVGVSLPTRAEQTTTIEKSLDNENTRRRLVRIQSVDELERMLDAPLEKWRVFLHPTQAQLVSSNFDGPALVTGGAGTGKTVVAMHRAKHLLQHVFSGENDRILFTTFTMNLAENIRSMLNEMCGDHARRLDVLHLDSWAVRLLKQHGESVSIATDDDIQQAWDVASMEETCPFDAVFIKNEWDFASSKRGVTSKADYMSLSRIGRPHRLDRIQKAAVWNAFEVFHKHLASSGLCSWEDVVNRANKLIEYPPYKSVIVDEAQDFQGPSWRLIRSLVAPGNNDIFLVGDQHQRIYGQAANLAACGVDVGNRIKQLKLNYRTTEQIRNWAVDQLTDPNTPPIVGGIVNEESRSLLAGPPPEILLNDTRDAELATVFDLLPKLLEDIQPEEIAITARAKWVLKDFQQLLDEMGISHILLDKKSDEDTAGVRLATMHRIKGLEFRCVIVVSANKGIIPDTYRVREDDRIGMEDHLRREKSLLYVATTRARDRAFVSTSGEPSPLISDVGL